MSDIQKDLEERTFMFARRVVRMFASLPVRPLEQTLGKQLLRSGTSVGANYSEALRSRSKAEFVSTMGLCLKELQECQFWLRLFIEENIFPAAKLDLLLQETKELTAIFTTIIKSTNKKVLIS